MAREPLSTAIADAPRWSELMDQARNEGASTDAEELDQIGRRRLAEERRTRFPGLRSWGPGDPQPASIPVHGLYDLDGAVWHYQVDSGCWRMSAADRRRYQDASHTYEGQRPWFYLADSEGPLTERPAPAEQAKHLSREG